MNFAQFNCRPIFRSAKTSWSTCDFVHAYVLPHPESRSSLQPYKSSQDHTRPLKWYIAEKRVMSYGDEKYKDKDNDNDKENQTQFINVHRLC